MQIFAFILIGFPFALAGFGSVMGVTVVFRSYWSSICIRQHGWCLLPSQYPLTVAERMPLLRFLGIQP